LEYTSDYFQCYDILLTNGLNTITLHATDPAGNTTTTNITVTLDYASANHLWTNIITPPIIINIASKPATNTTSQ
jgi:hypothetical protein